jgi:PhnB protein
MSIERASGAVETKMEINAYLTFPGTCAEALAFYKTTIGAEVVSTMNFRGAPGFDKLPPNWLDKIMHATFTVGSTTLMASDAMPDQPHDGVKGMSLSINSNDLGEAERVFKALSAGGKVTMPFQEAFWGARFGMLTDKFGVAWMVNCDPPKK